MQKRTRQALILTGIRSSNGVNSATARCCPNILDHYWSARTFSQNAKDSRNMPGAMSESSRGNSGILPTLALFENISIANQRLNLTRLLTRRSRPLGTAFANKLAWKLSDY